MYGYKKIEIFIFFGCMGNFPGMGGKKKAL